MKVLALPANLPAPETDWANYYPGKVQADEDEHRQKLRDLLISVGYDGPNTGKIVRFPVGDGHAEYMYADKPRAPALVHLPYGDAWQYRDVKWLPAKEILRRIKQEEEFAKLFKSG